MRKGKVLPLGTGKKTTRMVEAEKLRKTELAGKEREGGCFSEKQSDRNTEIQMLESGS